jgi:DNA mismatch repair protein MutL
VAKELIENAIDAGATEVRVETKQGGRRLIRVSDNGCGIPQAEAALAFARHATSKICSEDDLLRITTLGFRGEALASISAVSQVTMTSRTEGEATGTLLRVAGGEIVHHEKHGGRAGTVITVENLFYNTPARLKFLRSESTESSRIVELVSAYALAYPELSFHLVDNGRLVLQTSGSGRVYDVLIKVLDPQIGLQMLEIRVPHPESDLEPAPLLEQQPARLAVSGYVSTPSLHRATRSYQMFFVNRRWIQDRSLGFALEEAYHTLLPVGRHPVAVLSISVSPADVDVNVHPTKREVRFRDPREVFSAVQRAVRRTIIGQSPVAPAVGEPMAVAPSHWVAPAHKTLRRDWQPAGGRVQLALEVQRTADAGGMTSGPVPMLERLPMLRVLGQVRQAYIIAEGPDGLYLIDQHAAHERVLFDQLQAEQGSMTASSQTLLEPLPLDLPPQQRALLEPMLEDLCSLGFNVAPFGGDTYLVRSIPAALNPELVRSVITELIDAAREGSEASSPQSVLTIIACHSAVRAGQTLTLDEARQLIQHLEKTTSPYTCPHGRPTMIHLSSLALERSFGRR